jgi:hypothetical protein
MRRTFSVLSLHVEDTLIGILIYNLVLEETSNIITSGHYLLSRSGSKKES